MGPQRSPLSRVVVVVVVVVVEIGVRRLAVANGPNIFQMLLVYVFGNIYILWLDHTKSRRMRRISDPANSDIFCKGFVTNHWDYQYKSRRVAQW